MNENLLRFGDNVKVFPPKEDRDNGYDPCPDGTEAVVTGLSEIAFGRFSCCGCEPGIYANPCWIRLRTADGNEWLEYAGRLELADPRLLKARETEWIAAGRPDGKRLRDLPDTDFWEDDIVCIPGRPRAISTRKDRRVGGDICHYVVKRVQYNMIGEKRGDGAPWPAYDVSDGLDTGWNTSVSGEDATLVKRGRVWKLAHGETVVFESLQEEADLAIRMSRFDEVRNPESRIFFWTIEQALAAIRAGTIHGITVHLSILSPEKVGDRVRAIRYRDADLGRRVAAATLAGFAE